MSSLPETDSGLPGGRGGARLALLLCLLATLALPLWLYWPAVSTPRNWGIATGAMLGNALMVGLLPMIWWGFRRFRYERAGGPIILWVVLLLVLGGLTIKGAALG